MYKRQPYQGLRRGKSILYRFYLVDRVLFDKDYVAVCLVKVAEAGTGYYVEFPACTRTGDFAPREGQ